MSRIFDIAITENLRNLPPERHILYTDGTRQRHKRGQAGDTLHDMAHGCPYVRFLLSTFRDLPIYPTLIKHMQVAHVPDIDPTHERLPNIPPRWIRLKYYVSGEYPPFSSHSGIVESRSFGVQKYLIAYLLSTYTWWS